MKELVAAVIIAALMACHASAAEHHSRTPHRFHFERPGGGPYELTSHVLRITAIHLVSLKFTKSLATGIP